MDKEMEKAISQMMDHEAHIPHHSRKVDIKLSCTLEGKGKFYHRHSIIKASIEKLTEICHVLEIQGERFGVFHDYYKRL